MTGFQAAPKIAQVEMRYTVQDIECENVYHVRTEDAWDVAALGGLYDVVTNWEDTEAKGWRSAATALNSVRLVDLSTAGGAEVVSSSGLPIDGTDGAQQEPQNVTFAIKADSGMAGRSNRGRTYWIGLTKAHTSGGLIAAVAAADLAITMNALMTAINGGGPWHMCILSRKTGGHDRVHGVGIDILQWTFTDLYIDSQRRRLPGHNRHH